jgi:DNA primase
MTEEQKQAIVSILKRTFGSPKKEYEGLVEYEFNCPAPMCRKDVNKFNLGYNTTKGIFRCWKCNYRGIVHIAVSDYGSKDDAERLELILPKSKHTLGKTQKYDETVPDENSAVCELPEGFWSLSKKRNSKYYRKAMEYLKERKVDQETISKFDIGYTEDGPRKFRIIIPSKNSEGKINYYEARSYMPWVKPNYHKPDAPTKSEIIFNSANIDFNLPVFLVEGVFDMFPLYNAVAMLGKEISPLLLSKLVSHGSRVVICLDEDAIKDAISLYNRLLSYGLDVYFVEVKGDIGEYYQKHGRAGVIKLLKTRRKLDFKYVMQLSMKDKRLGKKRFDEKFLNAEWASIEKEFKVINKNIKIIE